MRNTVSGERMDEDLPLESLRPSTLADYIGQERVKSTLEIFIQAANRRREALDHVLLYGPPGLGKTTLARIVANELGTSIETTSGPALERPGDIAAILTNLQPGAVIFVDEIHRLGRIIEEKLYPAMEDFCLDLIIGQGPSARIIPLTLEPFTLIGATTRFGALSSPLRDRFGVICRLDYYSSEDLALVVQRSARIMNIELKTSGAIEIARRSRGTPRIANRLLRRVRDFAQVVGDGVVTKTIAEKSLRMMEIDDLGLDMMDRKLLSTVIFKFSGGPVGLDTLAAALSESKDTIEDVYEPYLIQMGFLEKTPRGRRVTSRAYRHMGVEATDSDQGSFDF